MTGRQLLTINEAAELLRLERTSIYRLIAKGDLSVIDVGPQNRKQGTPRIDPDELDAFVKRRTTNARRHYR